MKNEQTLVKKEMHSCDLLLRLWSKFYQETSSQKSLSGIMKFLFTKKVYGIPFGSISIGVGGTECKQSIPKTHDRISSAKINGTNA